MPAAAPILSLNGTPPERLMDGYSGAATALWQARKALEETEPNGRDYVGREDAWRQARAEHVGRLEAVERALREVAALRECVCDQMDEREMLRRQLDRGADAR